MEYSNVIVCDNKIYENWLNFINPIYNLSQKEIYLMSNMLSHFVEAKERTKSDDMANQILFSTTMRKQIKKELRLPDNYFDVLLNKLRNHGIIKENAIVPKVIPKFIKKGNKNSNEFSLLIYFKPKSND